MGGVVDGLADGLADGRAALLAEAPNHLGVLAAGDANVIDARLLHCGGGNGSARRRVVFYCSFKRRGFATAGTHSLRHELREAGLALSNTDEWACVARN